MNSKEIPTLLTTLLDRLEGREALDLEFKAARADLPKNIWPTISAFANTRGGWLLLGVGERNDTVTIDGVANPHALLQNLNDLMRNTQKISYAVCGVDDATVEALGDRHIIVLRVPTAARKMRPVYINGNPYTGTFVRRHTGDYLCNKAEVDRMMREASDVAADSTVLPRFGWDDLDFDTFARYRRRYQTREPSSPWNSYDDRGFLQAIGGFRCNRETGEEGVTVAGLLLLGKPEAVREWRTRHLIDYRLADSTDTPNNRWADRVACEGNLFTAFEAIYPRLVTGLRVPFRLEGGMRIDESPVHVVLREALVNLLVHADYAETQVSLILHSESSFLFRNPGSSRVLEADLLIGDRSDPRNPELVRMFRLVGLAEEAGTGIPKIIKAWRELGFQLPAIDVGTERYEFTLELRLVHLLLAEDRSWLRSLGNSWTEPEQLALILARHEGDVDNLALRRLTGQHPSDVTKVLGSLRDRGLLHMNGSGRNARYALGTAATADSAPLSSDSHLERSTPDDQLTYMDILHTLTDPQLNSEGTESSYVDKEESSEGKALNSEGKWHDLEAISAVARRRRRLDLTIRDAILIQLCSYTPLSLSELARLMDRSEVYLREALRQLIRGGQLSFLYPQQPSHPQQKYVTILRHKDERKQR